ncbi:MAG: hypothetical protein GY841_03180 [FCB group bacterium]|nr:hypothetical protein [FCB group bacterium]
MSILIMLVIISCSPIRTDTEEAKLSQHVYGIVTYIPGVDYEDATLLTNPPDLTPRPFSGAEVSLYRYRGGGNSAGEIIATTISDSTGYYKLEADTGTYFLAIANAQGLFMITTGKSGKNFDNTQQVNQYQVINLIQDDTVNVNFQLEEMSLY